MQDERFAMQNKINIVGTTFEGLIETNGQNVKSKLMPVGNNEIIEIDQALAAAIKEEATLPMPGQRPLDQKTVTEYMRLMTNGRWHISAIYIVEVLHDDGTPEMNPKIPNQPLAYLVNGNHTLQAVILSGVTILATVSVFRGTRADMHMLFSQIDNHRPRKVTTALEPLAKIFGQRPGRGKVEGKNLVPSKILEMVVTAVQWVGLDGLSPRPQSPRRDLAVIQAIGAKPFVRWLISINNDQSKPFTNDADGGSERWLWRIPVLAAMWYTWKSSEITATNFWSQITKPTPLSRDTPASVLRGLLLSNGSRDWGRNPNLRILKACSMAWLASCDNAPLNLTIEQVREIPEDSLSVILFDKNVTTPSVGKPVNAEIKHGSVDRRTSVEEEREGNEESHHVTMTDAIK